MGEFSKIVEELEGVVGDSESFVGGKTYAEAMGRLLSLLNEAEGVSEVVANLDEDSRLKKVFSRAAVCTIGWSNCEEMVYNSISLLKWAKAVYRLDGVENVSEVVTIILRLCLFIKPEKDVTMGVVKYVEGVFKHLIEIGGTQKSDDFWMSMAVLASHYLVREDLSEGFISLFQHEGDLEGSFYAKWKRTFEACGPQNLVSTQDGYVGLREDEKRSFADLLEEPQGHIKKSDEKSVNLGPLSVLKRACIHRCVEVDLADEELMKLYRVVCVELDSPIVWLNEIITLAVDCRNAAVGLTDSLKDPNAVLPQLESSSFIVGTNPQSCEMFFLQLLQFPRLGELFELCECWNQTISAKTKGFLQFVFKTGIKFLGLVQFPQKNGKMVALLFNTPPELFENSVNRLHYDIMFEAVDNASSVLGNDSFVSLLRLSTGLLEEYSSNYSRIIDYNSQISLLNPPLSSMALLCHLLHIACRQLNNRVTTFFDNVFKIPLPPIPIKRFIPVEAEELLASDKEESLVQIVVSLLSVLLKNLKLLQQMELTEDMRECEMVVAALISVAGTIDTNKELVNYIVGSCLCALLQSYPKYGFYMFMKLTNELSRKSIKLAGLSIQLLTAILKHAPTEPLEQSFEVSQHAVSRFVSTWYKTNSLCLDELLAQLKRLDQTDIIQQATPKPATIGPIGTPAQSYSLRTNIKPVLLDLSFLAESVPIIKHPKPSKRINSSQSHPNLRA
ncbi:hypothetical protein TRICI_003931 [Trichomonascus ciferrii]|uniref:Uncharacterized protein n=1 Tax=Trichomonascus ciferrii TaxID=44093 RepID=A0A642V1S2_9ASCO|nr:hypothetical protein TRICI_003931 [Trichomonascus ciferrii]